MSDSTKLTELIRDANREITPADRHAILDLIEAANARIAELEARPTAWVWCDSVYEEHCHLTDEEAIEDGWRPMVYSDLVPKLASKDARIALEQAQALISEKPHGDNCFVSNHYGCDPGNACYCGKSVVLDSIDRALAEFPPQVRDEDLYALLPGTHYMDPPDGGDPGLLEMLKRLALDAARYRWLRYFGKDGVNIKPPCEHVHACLYTHPVGLIPATRVITGNELDAAIDAALANQKEKPDD